MNYFQVTLMNPKVLMGLSWAPQCPSVLRPDRRTPWSYAAA